MTINLFEPYTDKSEEKVVLDVLRSKFWASGSGVRNVGKFELKFKTFIKLPTQLLIANKYIPIIPT